MSERDFIFWLQGFLEIADPETITAHQVQVIKDHMKLVLSKETPDRKEKKRTEEEIKKALLSPAPLRDPNRRIC